MDAELIEAIKTITPEMYRQTILWGWVTSISFTLFFVACSVALLWVYRKGIPLLDDADLLPAKVVIGCVGGIVLLGLVCGIGEIVRLIVAPYAYVLSQIGG